MIRTVSLLAALALAAVSARADVSPVPVHADVVVCGGTPSGVMAAVAAARHGHSVALLDLNAHVGGVVSGGLVDTDMGDRATVGGLADDFFKRIVKYYRDMYGADSEQFTRCRNGVKFEPHVAEAVFDQMLAEQATVKVWKRHRLQTVKVEKGRVVALVVDDLASGGARTFTGDVFIDASYEGDLMAGAGVPYRVGREGRAEFGEILAGISAGPKEIRGLGDHRTQAYNYRVSLTSSTGNRVLFPKPEHYDPEPWRTTYGRRVIERGHTHFGELYVSAAMRAGPNEKFDTNWGDLAGANEGYAEADWPTRDRIAARHRDYFLSLLWYLQNDPELPEAFRADARTWGLPKDEFADNGHFPFQLYVREARRMLGRYVLREQDLTQDRWKSDGVCAGSYGIDCHVVLRLLQAGKLEPDLTRHVSVENYDIPYRCLTPHEPANLLVPVCLSTTHVAYCSLRMEPVFMMLGHAAGVAAHLAIADRATVQNVDVPRLRTLLRQEGAVLDAGYQPQVKIVRTPEHPRPGDLVSFSIAADGLKDPLTNVWWDFDGTGAVSAQGEIAEHRFALEKVYSVSLVVEDQTGRRRLVAAEVPVGAALARDVTIDECDAELVGRWDGAYPEIIRADHTRTPDVFLGPGAHFDVARGGQKAPAFARFQTTLPHAGSYQVCLAFRPAKNQATNVPVTLRDATGTVRRTVDQRTPGTPFPFVALGKLQCEAGDVSSVEITNANTDGRVAIDGVRWVWLGD